jgi:hypothetical protein
LRTVSARRRWKQRTEDSASLLRRWCHGGRRPVTTACEPVSHTARGQPMHALATGMVRGGNLEASGDRPAPEPMADPLWPVRRGTYTPFGACKLST